MKKLFLALILSTILSPLYAQDDEGQDEKPKQGWTRSGKFTLLFNQAAFNADWQGGGTSNYAGNLGIDYKAIYKKGRFTWDNKFIGEYGLTKTKGDDYMRKTNDRIEVHSVAGYQVETDSNWNYSFFANFRSQFAKGYEYEEDVDVVDPVTGDVTGTKTLRHENTHFMSPGYLKFGPGILYERGEAFKANFAPATSRFIFADDKFTTITGYEDGSYYGLDQGKSMRFEFGASLDISSKFTLVKNVDIENNLSLYSNYLEDPKNVDLDYTLNLDMKINEYLSANFVFQAIYDDNAAKAFQIREVLGVGFSYKL